MTKKSTLSNSQISVTINHKGAELHQLTQGNKNYIWEIDTQFWNKTSPVLFPIVGSLKENTYFYKEKPYQLTRHGFARDIEFHVTEKTPESITFSLQETAETLQKFPFPFQLQIKYSIEKNTLKIEYIVENKSTEKMPYSLGAHPAFAINGNFTDYALEFDSAQNLITHRIQNDVLNGETIEIPLQNKQLPLAYKLFEKDAIVLKNHPTKTLTLLKNQVPEITLDISEFPFLGIWTQKNAPFICLEPWLGIADSHHSTQNIFEKEGIQILEPKASKSHQFSIIIH